MVLKVIDLWPAVLEGQVFLGLFWLEMDEVGGFSSS